MKIINCNKDYSLQILEIINDSIENSTALYDYKPWDDEIMEIWFNNKIFNNYPVIGIVDGENKLMGFGSYGQFRARPAYKYSVEISLYVHKEHRGKGLGNVIMEQIIKNAKSQNYHCLVAVIDSSNEISKKLHEKFGFEHCGTIKETGYKFDRWLDVDFYQLILPTPENPVEG